MTNNVFPVHQKNNRGITIWMTGLSGSGKTTIALELEQKLINNSNACFRLDGDTLRSDLCSDLGFDKNSRLENIRRVAAVSKLMNYAGLITIVSLISPYCNIRNKIKEDYNQLGLKFYEVFIDAPLEVCESRDPKGLYALARGGKIKEFTGIDSIYEPPTNPDLHLKTNLLFLDECVNRLFELIKKESLNDN
jgi:3'-phosphoadenosine 5'-phosphosulfate synthase